MTVLWPPNLRDEACEEIYRYVDKHVKRLPRRSDGSFDESSSIMRKFKIFLSGTPMI